MKSEKGAAMGAREKLNQGYFNGSLFVAAVLGGLMQSWLVFALTLCVLLAFNLYQKEIRPDKKD